MNPFEKAILFKPFEIFRPQRETANWTDEHSLTGMPGFFSDHISKTVPERTVRKIESQIGKYHIGLLTVQIADFYELVETHGEETGCLLLDILKQETVSCWERVFEDRKPPISINTNMNEILIFLKLGEKEIAGFSNQCFRFRIDLKNHFNIRMPAVIGKSADLLVGYGRIQKEQNGGFYKSLFRAFCIAKRNAEQGMDSKRSELHESFTDILENNRIDTLYQPIMNFETGKPLGWEALIRGPDISHFQKPDMLFGYAAEIGQVRELDRICMRQAVRNFGAVLPDRRLFVNIHADTLNDPEFACGPMTVLMEKHDLKPENIVLEYSEAHSSYDFNLLIQNLEVYRNMGFGVAIDDVGAGHANLRFISQIKPDFIKIDNSMTNGIDRNPIKRILTETLVALSEKIGAGIIAEGIETQTELTSLISMGIQYGQGFHIAEPAYPKASPGMALPEILAVSGPGKRKTGCSTCAGTIAHATVSVMPDTPISEVKKKVAESPPMGSIAVVDQSKPLGLLMKYDLDHKLGSLYGVSLYYHRPVSHLMDASPLVVRAGDSVDEIAKLAMKRDAQKIYDDIIVTESGRFMGVISVQQMLDALAQIRVKMAKGANPLTGLPGNVAIESELKRFAERRIRAGLIYIDLDNFKVYNDVYGFDNGDKIILYTAGVLDQTVKECGTGNDFIGHVGGDDFVVFTSQQYAESVAAGIVNRFPKGIGPFYSSEDFERGYIIGKGRDGEKKKFSLISVSVGIVDCDFNDDFNMDSLSRRMASVKKYAKSISGNAYVRDRRSGSAEKEFPKER